MERKQRFINRELSWLSFNDRVLQEGANTAHPLLERLRFLSISAANLDEFYMVRVAGLWGQIKAHIKTISDDGLTPIQQLEKIDQKAKLLINEQQVQWKNLLEKLRKAGVSVVTPDELNTEDLDWLKGHFETQIYPILTPMALDPAHPFPFIPNLGFGMFLELVRKK